MKKPSLSWAFFVSNTQTETLPMTEPVWLELADCIGRALAKALAGSATSPRALPAGGTGNHRTPLPEGRSLTDTDRRTYQATYRIDPSE